MNKFINSTILALAVIAVLSYGNFANAQNATNYRHDREHFFPGLGVRAHIGLGLPLVGRSAVVTSPTVVTTPSTSTTVTATPTAVVHRDFDRYHNWAFAHRDHFLFLNNRYIVLPSTVACPLGSQLNPLTGECQVVNQVILQQQAPVIQQEQIQVDPSTIVDNSATTVVQGQTSVVGQPVVSCPQGTLVNGQCVIETQSQQVIAPNVSCAVGTLVNGQCVEQQQQIVVGQSCGCPAGSTSVNGQCVVSALPSQVTVGTTPGEIIVLGHHFHHEGDLGFLRR